MNKKTQRYLLSFALLVAGFYYFLFRGTDNWKSKPAVISYVKPFRFLTQDGNPFTDSNMLGKVSVVEFFFTTCKGICPKMNTSMRRIYDQFKNEKDFIIVSHTCMPEVDSVAVLKQYERKMLTGTILKNQDGSYKLSHQISDSNGLYENNNWKFVTGSKSELYKLARQGYMIDNGKSDSTQRIENQFLHTQFFALVDRYGRVRGIYDGLIEDEIQKLLNDIPDVLKEKVDHTRFMNGFSNNPN